LRLPVHRRHRERLPCLSESSCVDKQVKVKAKAAKKPASTWQDYPPVHQNK
jgi:hypothetical protein